MYFREIDKNNYDFYNINLDHIIKIDLNLMFCKKI